MNREVEVELYGSTRATSPGALVVLRYSINSYEDQDERVRLHLDLPEGWVVLDRDIEGREFLLEAWENLEGVTGCVWWARCSASRAARRCSPTCRSSAAAA
jgi:hypothetical protein